MKSSSKAPCRTKAGSQKLPWRIEFKKYGFLYAMVLIPVVVLILFRYIPMYGVQIAFRNYKPVLGVVGSDWVGWKHFIKFFESRYFADTVRNTLVLNGYSLLTYPLCLVFALMINYMPSRRFAKTVQMVSYAPHFVSTVVICSLLTQFFNGRIGVFNKLIELLGGQGANWLGIENAFSHIYVWSGTWQEVGFNAIIFIAALSGVSSELHEAATIDGANLLQRIWNVDIPSVLPTFCILMILRVGSLMNIGYEKILLLQNDLNLSVSETISTYTYKIALQAAIPQYSYSSAIGLFSSVVNMILLFAVNRTSKAVAGSSLW